jgi:cytochrome c-type biogenesis protein CcmH/NrfG
MTTQINNKLVQPRHVVLVVSAGFVLLLATAFVYRITHPSLTRSPNQPAHTAADHEDGQAQSQQDMSAVRELMVRLSENPGDPETLKSLGREFMRMEAWEQAKGFLEQSVAAKPTDTDAMMMLGVALFNMQSFREAADQFELIVSLDEDNAMALYNLGVIYKHGLEDPDTARGYFNRVLESEAANEQLRAQASRELGAE